MKYYSEQLKKLFDSEEELRSAEKELEEKNAAENKKREERAAKAKEVEDAYKHYLELLKGFLKEYGNYHLTIKDDAELLGLIDKFFRWPF